jgi:hydroxylamine reductase (hybrid-cluster protein)
MEGTRISYHESVRKLYGRIKKDGIDNIWDRFEAQGMGGDPDRRCPFCHGGVRCDLCSNGPCRSDASKAYVVSESGTVKPSKKVDTLKAMPLLPGDSIIIPSRF